VEVWGSQKKIIQPKQRMGRWKVEWRLGFFGCDLGFSVEKREGFGFQEKHQK